MRKTNLLLDTSLALCVLLSSFPAASFAESSVSLPVPAASPNRSTEDVLSDLRDVRLCLAQVKQQSVNVFMEATRTRVASAEPALEHNPDLIDEKMIATDANYLPPRKEWLVFYVNTLEPTIHLLSEDLKDVDANHDRYPPEFSEVLRPLWAPWKEDVVSINQSLDQLQALIGQEKDTNIPLAKLALSIFGKVSDLEKIRYKAALAVREVVKKNKTKASN